MQKLYLSVIAAVIVGVTIAYTLIFAASSVAKSAAENSIRLSVDRTILNYDDTLTWNASNLPPNTEYTVTLRWPGTALVISKGNADANGEASGSFLIEENIPAGTVVLKVELLSDSTFAASTTLHIIP